MHVFEMRLTATPKSLLLGAMHLKCSDDFSISTLERPLGTWLAHMAGYRGRAVAKKPATSPHGSRWLTFILLSSGFLSPAVNALILDRVGAVVSNRYLLAAARLHFSDHACVGVLVVYGDSQSDQNWCEWQQTILWHSDLVLVSLVWNCRNHRSLERCLWRQAEPPLVAPATRRDGVDSWYCHPTHLLFRRSLCRKYAWQAC